MWPLTGAARQELAQSHTASTLVQVLHSGQPVYTLVTTAGTVTAEANRTVMRNLQATVTDPTGELSGGDIKDLLSPYDCEVAPWRGVAIPSSYSTVVTGRIPTAGFGMQPFGSSPFGGAQLLTELEVGWSTELAPLGVFRLTGREVAGDGSVQLTGQDRAMIYQGPMTGALAVSGMTPVESAIQALLQARNSGVQMLTWDTGFTCGPLLYQPDIDVWAEAQKLAQSVGGWLHHDRTGQLVFGPLLSTTGIAVARYGDGDGLLIQADRKEDADTIHNVVVMQSTNANNTSVIQAVAEDTDPTSPTYSRGPYGRRATTITNPHITSMAQAQQAAAAQLVQELGKSETVTLTTVPHPALDPLDTIIVNRPIAGLVEHSTVIGSIQLPLTVTDPATVTCRKYILTRDGQSITPALEQLT